MFDADITDAVFWFSMGVAASWALSLCALLWWIHRAPRFEIRDPDEGANVFRRVRGEG